jgi:serine/threonine-protein kinase RsbW
MHVVASPPGDDAGTPGSAPDLPDLHLTGLPAEGSVLPALRQQLTQWARLAGLDDDQIADLALATYEAMANVVDHAYDTPGGVFDLHACRVSELVTVTVADHGTFKSPPEGESLRRRGLLLIERTTCGFELVPHAMGTRVSMSWPVPDPTVKPR